MGLNLLRVHCVPVLLFAAYFMVGSVFVSSVQSMGALPYQEIPVYHADVRNNSPMEIQAQVFTKNKAGVYTGHGKQTIAKASKNRWELGVACPTFVKIYARGQNNLWEKVGERGCSAFGGGQSCCERYGMTWTVTYKYNQYHALKDRFTISTSET
ncbi:MAG: hypothetical protein GY834_16810 [Bacteroidetes bacterium]|nr:hypothetical protein [Bacteroidota bacterium]